MTIFADLQFSMLRILAVRVLFFLGVCVAAFVDSVGLKDSGGFTVSRFPALNHFALQCNGSNLPSDVRSVQHISLERHSLKGGTAPKIIASLSSVDGVRLENSHGSANVYVSGKFDVDNIQSTSLTVLLADGILDADVTYGCKISYIKRGGMLEIAERLLNVSFTDLQSLYKVQTADVTKSSHQLQHRVAQSTFSEVKEGWGTPMILLLTMAILLFVLLIICILLIIDRYRDHCRSKKRVDRLARKKGGSKEKEKEPEPRPLPSPPSWTYPEVIGAPLPRSPYNRLRFASVGRNLRDDTGYDSDASMNYCKPFDDLGEATTQEKPPFQTFGKQSSPIYATTPTIISA
ncbi:unnamed protein product [Lymnaea stagnalis]|uniref:Uncharacterized protein n=1 Tax=Lymnaea stagnalis TaxID=6523 RepID=A0AAV2HCT6_LYMST